MLALAGCKNDTVPEPTRYTVKFETAHGTAPADITVVSGTKLTAEQLKVLDSTDNYIFEGWYDGETKAEGGTYTVTKDVTLVAKWRDRGTVASVTFSPAGGTKFYFGKSIEVSLTSEEGATIQYHLGDGSWKDYDAGRKIQVTTSTTITARAAKEGLKDSAETKATYTLKWYTVSFNTDGGSTVASQTVESGQKATRPAAEPTLEGSWFLGWYSDEGLTKKFDFNTQITTATTVYAKWSYKLHTELSILTNYTSPNNTDGSWTYVEFREWPQTIEADGVTVNETESKTMGMFTYYLGDDGNYYVKITAKPYEDTYTYSDGNPVEKDKEVYFKVEPIVWRVLTEDYKDPDGNSTGNALLLAESILTGGIPYYVDIDQRTIGGQTVHPNNWKYSTIRAWLNGLDVVKGDDQEKDKTYTDKGFLQTAFTESARELIADTTVDNSAASTNPASNPKLWENGEKPYASKTPTTDKIFLLSEKEATNSEYDFDEYNKYVGDGTTLTSIRIRVTTDYAKATGAYQSSTPGYGGWWWLRSPRFNSGSSARVIFGNGDAYSSSRIVRITSVGVVPALSISLQ